MSVNPPAFPLLYGEGDIGHHTGMTLRDWFAGQIASGMAAHSGTAGASFGPGDIAVRTYEVADAMLAARAPLSGSSSASTEGGVNG